MIAAPTVLPPGSTHNTPTIGRLDLVVAGLLALVFFCIVYLPLGLKVVYSPAALVNNLLFGGDLLRVIEDIAVFDTPHWRTVPHPNFLIIFNPLGVALAHFSSPQIATAVFLASAGSLAVALMHLNLIAAGLPRVTASLWAITLGASGTQLIFSVVPETYIFSAATLLFLTLMLQTRAGGMRESVLGGVMAMSILITNVIPAAIMFWSSLQKKQESTSHASILRRCLIWAMCVVAIMASLNVVQRLVYDGAGLALNPVSLQKETARYSFMPNSAGLVDRMNNLSQTLGLVNFIPPKPQTQSDDKRYIVLRSDAISEMGTPYAWWGVALVLTLWLGTIAALVQQQLWRDPLTRAILLCLAFNFTLHMIYGATEELYLYSCNWTALVVLLLARSWRDWINTPYRVAAFNICLAVLAVILLQNSLNFMNACLRIWALS
jgi:hypothetical protein